MKIAIAYDCWFPYTKGGAERWLKELAQQLVVRGHDVTFVTRDFGQGDNERGISVAKIFPADDLYARSGVRKTLPALRFARALYRYLKTGPEFDAVYVHQTPLWPVLAAKFALRKKQHWWAVEWIEWWSLSYWRSYLGFVSGTFAYLVQRFALQASPVAITYANLTTRKLRGITRGLEVIQLPGQIASTYESASFQGPRYEADGHQATNIVFIGRLVPEKRPILALMAMRDFLSTHPEAKAVMIGTGPLADELRELADNWGLPLRVVEDASNQDVINALRQAFVLLHPSAREGFGLVVVEAASFGVPTILIDGEDNAAVDLVTDGFNGRICLEPTAQALGSALEQVYEDKIGYRARTVRFYEDAAKTRSVSASCEKLLDIITDGSN